MSETMSSLSSDWAQFYPPNLSVSMQQAQTGPTTLFSSNEPSNTTMVTTTTVTRSSSGIPLEGRVSKPIRKRSRISRRTPTTLLNTDTTNFRAMVQQFTGGPMAPFASVASYPSGASVSILLGNSQAIANPNTIVVPMAGYNAMQFQQQQQHMHSVNNSGSLGDRYTFLRGSRRSTEPFIVDSGGGIGMEGSFLSATPSSDKDMDGLITCYEEEMMGRGRCNNIRKGNN